MSIFSSFFSSPSPMERYKSALLACRTVAGPKNTPLSSDDVYEVTALLPGHKNAVLNNTANAINCAKQGHCFSANQYLKMAKTCADLYAQNGKSPPFPSEVESKINELRDAAVAAGKASDKCSCVFYSAAHLR